ncbi:MAG: hypothetical protein LBK99_10070, partial [Opitutaceae bacterium]|nr:hypothetical protein [Opitutaceae bacterium]
METGGGNGERGGNIGHWRGSAWDRRHLAGSGGVAASGASDCLPFLSFRPLPLRGVPARCRQAQALPRQWFVQSPPPPTHT